MTKKPWLTIIGIGADGLTSLTPAARRHVDVAEIIITAKRTAAFFTDSKAEVHTWPVPFDAMFEQFQQWKGKKIVILATGDPLWHGVGSIIARRLDPSEFEVIPAPSAFSLAAGRLGWPLSSVQTLTLHGRSRPSSLIIPFIQPDVRLMALTSGSKTVHEVARHLVDKGYGKSTIHVLEDMDEPTEQIISFMARDIPDTAFSDFNTLGIDCVASPEAPCLPRSPGLPDDAYKHDGQLTKRDVRAITLAALSPTPGKLLWDVGAGCGSVAIEWMRTHLSNQSLAFESHAGRIELINHNAQNLGTPYLKIIKGKAPQSLEDQPAPDAIFIGGGITTPKMFKTCWRALKPGGRLVANCVTLKGKQKLIHLQQKHGGDLVEISIAHLAQLGNKPDPQKALRPALAVLQWRITK